MRCVDSEFKYAEMYTNYNPATRVHERVKVDRYYTS
jgi:hypothetical protein